MNFKGKMRKKSGITLISLVVTIIILLILAGITIGAISGDNGLIQNAGNAKKQTEIAEEKEIIDRATIQAMGKNKRGNLVKTELQEELDNITNKDKTEVLKDSADNFYVCFIDTNRYYDVDKDGNVEGPVEVDRAVDKNPGDITKDKDGNVLTGNTEEEAYEIWCIEDLCELSNSCNNGTTYDGKYIKLMINLDFKSDLSYINGKISTEGNIPNCNSKEELQGILTNGEGFCPIGTGTNASNSKNFRGNFNGNYNEIMNLYVNREYKAGLFGSCWSAKIENITVKGYVAVKNDLSSQMVQAGGITAYSRNSKFINCTNYANIKDTKGSRIGGISGVEYNDGSEFINCANYGNITKEISSNNAGILGWDWSVGSKIYNCSNAGKTNNGIFCNISNTNLIVMNSLDYGALSSMIPSKTIEVSNCFKLIQESILETNPNVVIYEENQMKSIEFVNELNAFIETGGNGENIDTIGWAKWLYNENEFPTLDMKTTWTGTEWITMNE